MSVSRSVPWAPPLCVRWYINNEVYLVHRGGRVPKCIWYTEDRHTRKLLSVSGTPSLVYLVHRGKFSQTDRPCRYALLPVPYGYPIDRVSMEYGIGYRYPIDRVLIACQV